MLKDIKRKLSYIKRGIYGFLQNKIDKFANIPSGLDSFEIGKSIKGATIRCFRIGNGEHKLLYTFGIHGNEVGTVKLGYRFLKWGNDNAHKIGNFTLYIIPCLNPDGFDLACQHPNYFAGGKIGRLNANNVDLNRNFKTSSFQKESVWCFGKNFSEQSKVYCGEYGNSEPETKALTNFISEKDIKILFMFHNVGKEVMGNRSELSQKLTRLFCDKTGFHYVSDESWIKLKQTGTAKEWCDEQNIAYVEIEGSTRWGSDWNKQKEALISVMHAIN